VTFISSRPLLRRGDLRRTLGHQSNALRGLRAFLSYRADILNIQWQEKEGWRGMVGKEDGGRSFTLAGRSLGLGRYECCFLDIPSFTFFQCSSTFQHRRHTADKWENIVMELYGLFLVIGFACFLPQIKSSVKIFSLAVTFTQAVSGLYTQDLSSLHRVQIGVRSFPSFF
jgi:hypothetical protein